MNPILFVLVLASADGGINTDLKFTDGASCRATAISLMSAAKTKDDALGERGGVRYLRAVCVPAANLVL